MQTINQKSDEEIAQDLYSALSDKLYRLNHLYKIKDKNGVEIVFKLNPDQMAFYLNRHNKDIILKARQKGFTTFACIDMLDDCLFTDNLQAGIIAHNIEDAEDFFENKIKFAYDNLDQDIKDTVTAEQDRAGKLKFSNGSSLRVRTSFRSGTLQRLHISEYGKICAESPKKAKEIKSGAFNAISINQRITIESTAEGMVGDFYKMCEKSQNRGAENLTKLDFKFHFFPWYQSEEYRLDPTGIELPFTFAEYFKSLKEHHSIELDDWQKAWYYKKSEEQDDDMKQEYPSYPEEAFRASGRPVFNLEKLSRDIKRSKLKTPIKGVVTPQGFDEIKNGSIHIWKKPNKEEAYAIGADVAEGLVDGDFSTASVLNKNFEQVATYCGHLPPDQFGAMLVNLAKYYNGALLAPEINNMGISVIEAIKRAKYYKVYKREVKEELGQDRLDKVGWHTNIKTKMQMIDDLKAAFRDDVIMINDEATLREMMTLTVEDDGNIEMNSKDRTVALAISIQAIRQANIEGEYRAYVPQKTVVRDVTKLSIEDKLKFYKRINRE